MPRRTSDPVTGVLLGAQSAATTEAAMSTVDLVGPAALAESMRGGVIEEVLITPEAGEMVISFVGGRMILVVGAFIVGSCVSAVSVH